MDDTQLDVLESVSMLKSHSPREFDKQRLVVPS